MPLARRQHLITIAAAIGGLVLFAYAVRKAGVAEIADGIRRVGWGLIPVLALGGLRFMLRAECWRLCMPADVRLRFWQALSAFLAGDAIGSVTPLGLAASEPAKVFLTRHRLATRESVASLAVDNLVYAVSVFTVVLIGAAVMLATVQVPIGWREAAVVTLVGIAAAALVGARLLRGTWNDQKGPRPEWRARLASTRESVLRFSAGHPSRLWRVYALHMGFHALAILEVFLILRWLLGSATFTQALLFETLNRVITVVFKFVPFRIGIDEALSGALATVLAGQPAAGVTLAVARKIRSLFWAAVGLLLIAGHPAQAVPETDRPGSVSAHRT